MRAERYRCHCRDCPVRDQCTRDPKGRQIEVWPHTPAVQAMRARLEEGAAQTLLARRQEIIEPRFAQIKQHEGFRRWTVWGLEGVRTQWSLLCASLNLRVLYRHWRAGRGGGVGAALAGRTGRMKKVLKARAGIGGRVREWLHAQNTQSAAGLFSPALSALRPTKYF